MLKKVYICAPLKDNVRENLRKVRKYTEYALRCGTAPVVPHFYALCLNDKKANERTIGMKAGQSLLWFCDELWVFGDVITEGMQAEIQFCNANISIIPRETYDKAQKLLAERQTDNPGNNKNIFSNYIFCSKCGRSFRKIVNRGTAYWMSSVTDASNCICKHTRIKESAIFDAFSMMRFKLADNRESLIDTTIQMIEKLQDNVGNGANDIREIDEKIAKLSAQNHVLAKLHNNGILPAAEFTKQSSEIAYKITELRTTRRKILSESENAETIDELSELNAALMESESTENFDEILFENIVKRIFVINNACIKFSLLGGLEATEEIREKERCKNRV